MAIMYKNRRKKKEFKVQMNKKIACHAEDDMTHKAIRCPFKFTKKI